MRLRPILESGNTDALRELLSSPEVLRLPSAMLSVVAQVTATGKGSGAWAGAFLLEARGRHPNDFWLNESLYRFFCFSDPPRWQEALRFATVAAALRPESPGAHEELGWALEHSGRIEQAIAEYREATRLQSDFFASHRHLALRFTTRADTHRPSTNCRRRSESFPTTTFYTRTWAQCSMPAGSTGERWLSSRKLSGSGRNLLRPTSIWLTPCSTMAKGTRLSRSIARPSTSARITGYALRPGQLRTCRPQIRRGHGPISPGSSLQRTQLRGTQQPGACPVGRQRPFG